MDTTSLNPESEYLGITEAADYLRVSASTLRRWEKKGFLVPERTPTGIRRYTKKQLDDVIQTPAYEKPAVSPQGQSVATASSSSQFEPQQSSYEEPEVYQTETMEEYVHIVEPVSEAHIAQHIIDSQIEVRPSSYTSLNIEHGYGPKEDFPSHTPEPNDAESKPQESHDVFSHIEEHKDPEQTEVKQPSQQNAYAESYSAHEPIAADNFATIEQQQFNHIFDIRETNDGDDEVELDEYDTDAAYVNSEPRASSYSAPESRSTTKKKSQSWIKPVFLFVSLFLAIVIISLVAWFALSSSSVSGAPLNPVIE